MNLRFNVILVKIMEIIPLSVYNKINQIEETINYVEKTEEDLLLLLAYKGDEASGQKSWYLDSGATNHPCGHRSMFVE